MVLWRISIYGNLSGVGAELSSGRWHTKEPGKRMVHLSEHPALALVEVLVNLHFTEKNRPEQYQLLRIDAQDNLVAERIDPFSLPENWRDNPELTRTLGDKWLRRQQTPLLAVPSAPAPESTNYLFNPRHPDAGQVSIEWAKWLRYDHRFFQVSR